jgi:SAM-dependent methyltransferase
MIGKRYEYDTMAACEQDLWWYKCLHEQTLQALESNGIGTEARIMDAGCGTGGMLKYLKDRGYEKLIGFDLSADAVEYASDTTGLPIYQHSLTEPHPAWADQPFDAVISNDTFCLLPAPLDRQALALQWDRVKPGGILIFNLAALEAFQGTHDVSVDMEKRYNSQDIRSILPPDATVVKMIYWPFLLSPMIAAYRGWQRLQLWIQPNKTFASDVKMPPNWQNRLFYKITQWEIQHMNHKAWGSSVFTVIRKKK